MVDAFILSFPSNASMQPSVVLRPSGRPRPVRRQAAASYASEFVSLRRTDAAGVRTEVALNSVSCHSFYIRSCTRLISLRSQLLRASAHIRSSVRHLFHIRSCTQLTGLRSQLLQATARIRSSSLASNAITAAIRRGREKRQLVFTLLLFGRCAP